MNMGSAATLVKTWIYSQLSTNATIQASAVGDRIHPWPIPDEFAVPYIVFLRRGAPFINGPLGQPANSVTIRFEVKVVDNGEYGDSRIADVAEQIQTSLDGFSVDLAGGIYITSQLVSDLPLDLPVTDETAFNQLGGIYEFFVAQGA